MVKSRKSNSKVLFWCVFACYRNLRTKTYYSGPLLCIYFWLHCLVFGVRADNIDYKLVSFFFVKANEGLIMVAAGDQGVHGGEDFYIWCVQFNKTYKDWKTASGKIIIYPLRCQCPGFQCQIFWQHPIVRKHLLHLMALVGVWWLDQRN